MALNICEIFHSLQGESTYAGLPCVFVRLSQCNLSCAWCDTQYSQTETPQPLSIEAVYEAVKAFDCNLVEITGGEPLLQKETPALIDLLITKGHEVLLETNGTMDIAPVNPACVRILDVKCPSSGEAGSFFDDNFTHLTPKDEIKFVTGSRQDYEYARQIIQTRLMHHPAARIHISPVFGQVTPETLAQWIIDDNLHARLSLQQHKIIWDPEQRGV